MCNQEIKFKLFLDTALENGADYVATGHYARTKNGELMLAEDSNKDQTYFLYRVTKKALEKTLFPLGDFTKPEVRKMAEARGLVTAAKKDSVGICFVGQIGMREFLGQYVTTKPGDIIDKQTNKVLGRHDGAIFYTLGQRHGLELGGGLPYYVVGKDMSQNVVYVSQNLQDEAMWRSSAYLENIHWIGDAPANDAAIEVRIRHRAPLVAARLNDNTLHFADAQRALTPGQSAVFYSGDICLGGGILV